MPQTGLQDGSVLSAALAQAGAGHWLFDPRSGRWELSASARRLLGLDARVAVDRELWLASLPGDARPRLEAAWHLLRAEGQAYEIEYPLELPAGTRWLWESVSEIGEAGAPRQLLGVVRDVTAARLAEGELRRRANHDPLTGLPNRRLLEDFLHKCCASACRRNERLALLLVDLDRFKAVNDTYGHAVGDLVLQAAARRMEACLRGSDMVARQGGDEFIVVLQNVEFDALVGLTALRLIEELSRPFGLDGREISIGASVGIALMPEDGTEIETALGRADRALYGAKRGGRETLRFFEEAANADQI